LLLLQLPWLLQKGEQAWLTQAWRSPAQLQQQLLQWVCQAGRLVLPVALLL
jgi:hypothetical protein